MQVGISSASDLGAFSPCVFKSWWNLVHHTTSKDGMASQRSSYFCGAPSHPVATRPTVRRTLPLSSHGCERARIDRMDTYRHCLQSLVLWCKGYKHATKEDNIDYRVCFQERDNQSLFTYALIRYPLHEPVVPDASGLTKPQHQVKESYLLSKLNYNHIRSLYTRHLPRTATTCRSYNFLSSTWHSVSLP